MRHLISLTVFAAAIQLNAQCSFTPTIDPPDLLMCPVGSPGTELEFAL